MSPLNETPPNYDATEEEIREAQRTPLEWINHVAADKKHKDQVSVISLPPGKGKSTAASEKIREVIQAFEQGSREGLLIIANTHDQMNAYLEPYNDDLRDYIQAHTDLVVNMQDDNVAESMQRMGKCPVLIIALQRYQTLQYLDIVNHYLVYKNRSGEECRRSLVLIDEEPNILDAIDLSDNEFNEIDTALRRAITDIGDQKEKEWCIHQWVLFRAFIQDELRKLEQYARESNKGVMYGYYVAPAREIEGTPVPVNRITLDDARFWTFIYKHIKDFTRFRMDNDTNKPDAYHYLLAVRQLMNIGAVFTFNSARSDQGYRYYFTAYVDNMLHFTPFPDTKMIILDATGRYSPSFRDDEAFDVRDCKGTRYPLSNSTIYVVNMATGKSTLKNEEALTLTVERVRKELAKRRRNNEPFAIFTYKNKPEEAFQAAFPDAMTAHFGAIRGINDFQKCSVIVQVGMNRLPQSSYFAYELIADPQYQAKLYQEAAESDLCMVEIPLNNLRDKRVSFARQCMEDFLLMDFEQSFYRGIIRRIPSAKYTYILVLSQREYANLISRLEERFGKGPDGYKANVHIVRDEDAKLSACDLFLQWYAKLLVGSDYTTADIAKAMQLRPNQKPSDFYKANETVKNILKKDFVARGHYKKK